MSEAPSAAPAAPTPDQTLQLRDGHTKGSCAAAWAKVDGEVLHVTAGLDGRVCCRRGPNSLLLKAGDNSDAVGFNCIAVTPDGKFAVTGDEQYTKAWKLPGCELEGNVCRFELPVRALAVSPNGTQVASGGDDGMLKVSRIEDKRTLKQKKLEDYICSIAWDPEDAYLAASTAGGLVVIYDNEEWKEEAKRRVAPKVERGGSRRLGIAWHPDGGVQLAVPGTDKDVVLLERLNWRPMGYLAGGHEEAVDLVTWSPNGLYLASMDTAAMTCLWLVEKAQQLRKLAPCSQPGASLAWHPQGNSLVVGGQQGGVAVLADVVPVREELPCPWAPPDELLKAADAKRAGSPTENLEDSVMEDADEEEGGLNTLQRRRGLKPRGGAPADSGVTGAGAGTGTSEAAALDEDILDDLVDTSGVPLEWPGMPRKGAPRGGEGGGGGGASRGPSVNLPRVQSAVQPGSTPPGVVPVGPAAGARFLAYNEIGLIVSRQVEGHKTVEVSFHDTTQYRHRVPLLTDYYGFTLGALGPRAVLYAAPAGADTPAVVVCRQFESWTSNSDWTVALPKGEAPVALAIGTSTAAVATNRQLLRLYTPAGRCGALLSLPGPVVALAARDHLLAVVTGGLPNWANSGQQLHYQVYDTSNQQLLHSGAAVVSPGASLTWCAFSDTGVLATVDSRGVLRLRTAEWGGGWVPVLNSAAVKAAADSDLYWPVAVNGTELTCVLTTPAQPQPAVLPRPSLVRVPLAPLVAPADAAPGEREAAALLQGLTLVQLRAQAAAGDDSPELTEAIAAAEFASDLTALRQLQEAVVAGRQARGLEAVAGMHLERSIAAALKFANTQHLPALAERITLLQEQRSAWQQQREQQEALAGGYEEDVDMYGDQQQEEEDGEGYGGQEEAVNLAGEEEEAAGQQQQQQEEGGLGRPGEPKWAADLRALADDDEEEEGGEGAGGGQAAAPGSKQQQQPLADRSNSTGGSRGSGGSKPVAAIFNRQGSNSSKSSGGAKAGGGAAAGAKRRPELPLPAAGAGGGAKGNPFARVKR